MSASRQPFRATLLLWLVLLFTVMNGLRAWTAFAWRAGLEEFAPASAWYTGLSGLFWFAYGTWTLRSLLLRKPKARILLLSGAAGYSVWYWCVRLFWQMPRPNWPFALALNLVLVSCIFFASKFWKRESHERKPQNQTIE